MIQATAEMDLLSYSDLARGHGVAGIIPEEEMVAVATVITHPPVAPVAAIRWRAD